MNWSTRLRRWVRIRTPPVRECLDEADRGDRLAGAGRVLEPEAALGAGVLGRLLDASSSSSAGCVLPVLRLLVGRQLVVLLVELALAVHRSSTRSSVGGSRRVPSPPSAGVAVAVSAVVGAAVCCSAISSARVPESASTWCGFSSAPSRSFGGSSASRRSSPSSSEKSRRHSIEGSSAPVVELAQRGVEGAPARGARGQRLRPLAVEQEGLAGELRRPLDVGA